MLALLADLRQRSGQGRDRLVVHEKERGVYYVLRARAEVIDPAEPRLRACIDRHLPDPPNINFVHVHMFVGEDGIPGEVAVRAVHENEALRACLFDELVRMQFAGPGIVWFRLVDR